MNKKLGDSIAQIITTVSEDPSRSSKDKLIILIGPTEELFIEIPKKISLRINDK